MIYGLPIKKIIIFFLIILAGWGLYNFAWYGTVKTDLPGSFTLITLDNEEVSADELRSGIKLRPGKHTLNAYGPLVRPGVSTLSVVPFREIQVKVQAQDLSAQQIFDQLTIPDKQAGYAVKFGKILENNTWLVGYVFDPEADREGYINIYRFNGREWSVFESGTGFD
ncbi:MAG: hypothetical protein M3Q14_03770, partial [bacterium]|nr:hypothetical protein [bacterium]